MSLIINDNIKSVANQKLNAGVTSWFVVYQHLLLQIPEHTHTHTHTRVPTHIRTCSGFGRQSTPTVRKILPFCCSLSQEGEDESFQVYHLPSY